MVKLSEVKAGDKLILDAGFTCHAPGEVEIEAAPRGELYFVCNEGQHFIAGQADDGETLVGMSHPTE